MTTAEKCEKVGVSSCSDTQQMRGYVAQHDKRTAIRNFNYPIEPVRITSLLVRSPGTHLDATPTTSRRNSGIRCIISQPSSVSHRNSVSIRFGPLNEASHTDIFRQDYKFRYT